MEQSSIPARFEPLTEAEADALHAALWCTAAQGGCTQPPHPAWQRGYAAHMERVGYGRRGMERKHLNQSNNKP